MTATSSVPRMKVCDSEDVDFTVSAIGPARHTVSGQFSHLSQSLRDDISLALGEALTNCSKHGKDTYVYVTCCAETKGGVVIVEANSHQIHQDFLRGELGCSERIRPDSERGRGLEIIRTLSDPTIEGNRLIMKFPRSDH